MLYNLGIWSFYGISDTLLNIYVLQFKVFQWEKSYGLEYKTINGGQWTFLNLKTKFHNATCYYIKRWMMLA